MIMLLHRELTKSIIGAFYRVYDKLDYGYFENVYCGALTLELRRRGHRVQREVRVPVYYDGVIVARYRMDFVVDGAVVLDVKSTRRLPDEAHRQLLNYLRCTNYDVGLILHFGPKPQFHRLISSDHFRRD